MRHSSSRWSVLLSAVILSLSLSTVAYGQLGKGVITGTVTDPSGASVPGAQVTLVNDATGVERSVITNTAGLYRFEFADVGTYTLKVDAQNFTNVEVRGLVLTVAQTVTEDVQLELARGAVQTITVEAAGVQLVETDKAEVSGLVDRNTLAALPLEIRDPITFVNLLPGAIPSAVGNFEFNGSTRGSAVNGARGGMGNFLLDGFDNNDQGQGGRSHNTVGSMPGAITGVSPDAIQEFRVITNNFSAQYGRQAGFVADAVVKSGTNQLHGSLFEYNRTQAMAAQDFFSNKSGVEDSLVRNQFGGSLGGPIVPDKTFFFVAVEIQRLRQGAPNVITSITPDFINFVQTGQYADFLENDPNGMCNNQDFLDFNFGDGTPGSGGTPAPCPGLFPNSRTLGPIAQSLIQSYPVPVPTSNFSNTSQGFWFYGFDYPVPIFGDADIRNNTTFNQNRITAKIDHNLGAADRLTGMMSFDDFDTFDSSLGGDAYSPYFPAEVPSRAQNWGLTYTHIFAPTILNEFKVSYLRHKAVFERSVAPEIPSIVTAFDPLGYSFGHTSAFPQGGANTQFQYQDHIAINRGRHSINVGFEYRRTRNGGVFDAAVDGFFLPYDTENLLTDGWFGSDTDLGFIGVDYFGSFYFAQAAVDPETGGRPDSYRGFRANEFGSYIQDDWRVSSRLTLNFGLRWDYYGVPHNFRTGYDSNFFFGPADVPIQTTSDNPFFPLNSPAYAREATADFQQRDSDLWAKDKNNFGPRFGFAWDVAGNHKTVVRGGGGVYYDRIWNNLFENIRFNPPRYSFNTVGTFINGVPISPTASPGLYSIPIDNSMFAAFTGSTSPRHMDENLRTPYMEQVFFGIQREITGSMVFEADYVGTFGHKLTGVVDLNTFPGRTSGAGSDDRPNTTISRDNARGNYWNSNYHALQIQVRKRMSRGLQFQTNYTWSKNMDYVSDAFNNRQGNDIYPLDTMNRILDYGRADSDLRHRFVTAVLYELPVWRQNRWAGGWQLGSIVTLQTGLPFPIYDSNLDSNADGNYIDRPDYVGSGSIQDLIDTSSSPADNYIDSSAFADPTLDPNVNDGWWINGNLGRNVISGPGLAVVDFSLQKKFQFTERVSLRLDVNFFNIFNRPNFGLIEGNLADSAFGRSTNTFGARVGQIAARIDF